MHVARCVIISPFFLFSLSHILFGTIFSPHPSFFLQLCLLFSALSTRWRTTPFYFIFLFFISPPHFVCLCPSTTALLCPLAFPSPAVACLPLSVMAYQEGFYSAADLYVSMPVSSTASLVTDHFFLLSLGFQV